jgi:hypothetical protein
MIPLTLYPPRGSRGISDSSKFYQNYLAMSNTADVVNAINPLVAFTTSMEERERCYFFILSQTPHETYSYCYYFIIWYQYNIVLSGYQTWLKIFTDSSWRWFKWLIKDYSITALSRTDCNLMGLPPSHLQISSCFTFFLANR